MDDYLITPALRLTARESSGFNFRKNTGAREGKVYRVRLGHDGQWRCSCEAFKYSKENTDAARMKGTVCKHCEMANQLLQWGNIVTENEILELCEKKGQRYSDLMQLFGKGPFDSYDLSQEQYRWLKTQLEGMHDRKVGNEIPQTQ